MSCKKSTHIELKIQIRWLIRRDMHDVLDHRTLVQRSSVDRRGFFELPPPAELHRHGRRVRSPHRGLHDL